jgi:NRPS condensation-like uncharacterized protein
MDMQLINGYLNGMRGSKQVPWLRLDNAANLYPSLESKNRPLMFNVSAVLKEEIDPKRLQKAVDITSARFPYFSVELKAGLFWHYFDHVDQVPTVRYLDKPPCGGLSRKQDGHLLYRVTYRGKEINVDFFHALTDGNGAFSYLNTLLLTYLRLSGHNLPRTPEIHEPEDTPAEEEQEDAYRSIYQKQILPNSSVPKAFHLPGPFEPSGSFHLVTGRVSISALKEISKPLGVSITEYLSAVFIYNLYTIQKDKSLRKRPVRLSVPVNLRNLFPTRTLRNFVLFVRPEINPSLGDFTFEEILKLVHHSMRYQLEKKHLSSAVSANVALEKHLIVKLMPLAIKKLVMIFVYRVFGENLYSGSLSNIGLIHLPKELEQLVESFRFTLGHNRINPENCAVIGYKEDLYITFSRTSTDPIAARRFFRFLTSHDIPVTITQSM